MYASLLLSLVSISPATADSQPFVLSSDVDIWPAKDIDSGWWPEEGPVRVRAEIFAEGVAGVDLKGDSVMSQNNGSAQHSLDAATAEGVVSIALDMAASLHLSLDVVGYEWEGMLREETVEFDLSQSFSSLGFTEDGGADLAFLMDTKEVFSIEQGILPLVNVVATGSLTPTADVRVNTDVIETGEGTFTAAGQVIPSSGGAIDLDAAGAVDSALYLVLQGHAEVCITWVDCYGDFNYDFDLDPIESTQDLTYETATVSHSASGGLGDALSKSADDDAKEESGGCSTVPAGAPVPVTLLLVLAAVVLGRRRS